MELVTNLPIGERFPQQIWYIHENYWLLIFEKLLQEAHDLIIKKVQLYICVQLCANFASWMFHKARLQTSL